MADGVVVADAGAVVALIAGCVAGEVGAVVAAGCVVVCLVFWAVLEGGVAPRRLENTIVRTTPSIASDTARGIRIRCVRRDMLLLVFRNPDSGVSSGSGRGGDRVQLLSRHHRMPQRPNRFIALPSIARPASR